MVELLLGPPLEEDTVGQIIVDPSLAREALARLTNDRPYDRTRHRHVRAALQDALARTVRAIVKWESVVRQLPTSTAFLEWLMRQPWDIELLAVPAVQERIGRIRTSRRKALRRELGRWLERGGAVGRAGGPVPGLDLEALLPSVVVATRQLERLWKILQLEHRRAWAKKHEWSDALSSDQRRAKARADAWTRADRRCRRIVSRLERAGLADQLRRDQWKRLWSCKQLACELVALENHVGATHLKYLARKKRS
jgi:hypothetical protein